jgi:hypothetical protein
MFKQVATVWKANYGPLLFTVGSVAAVMMCIMWYRNMIPEIALAEPVQLPRRLNWNTASCYFVARIERTGSSPEGVPEINEGRVVVYSYDPNRESTYDSPLLSKEFVLGADGTATVVIELRAGMYTAYAFLDTIDNGRLDTDPETRAPLEPAVGTGSEELLSLHSLGDGAFSVEVDKPHFCLMKLDVGRQPK